MKEAMPARPSPLIQIGSVPQIVPSRSCLTCDVCCRFPEADSMLRPYFSAEEARQAIKAGVNPRYFPDPEGGHVAVVPNPEGEGYHCPAFDAATSQCRIYDVRPLDCQIYPLAVMWNEDRSRVLLGWDPKCPFLAASPREARGDPPTSGVAANPSLDPGSLERYAENIARLLEQPETAGRIAVNPRLITSHQDDVVVLRPLPRLTERLMERPVMTGAAAVVAAGGEGARASGHHPLVPHRGVLRAHAAGDVDLRPLLAEDYARFASALASVQTPLAAYAVIPHVVWSDFFQYSWAEVEGRLCLFADYPDGVFMPLPPLGAGSLAPALARAFAMMRHRNHGSAVSRIENIPEESKAAFKALGYRVAGKDPDYLYEAKSLVELAGDPYKSQRAACNRFRRERRFRYEPFARPHGDACLDLYRLWAAQKGSTLDGPARQMLEDAERAHRRVLLGEILPDLLGRVMWVDDCLAAYTFGYPRGKDVFCVLLEVADRSIPGLAAFLFRTFSTEAINAGFRFINTMDDSGLGSLARSKQGYRPAALVASYIATES